MNKSIVGNQIKVAREEMGMSQTKLAESIGITRAGISKLEGGAVANPTMETLARMSSVLNKPIDFFYKDYTSAFERITTPTFRSFARASKRDNEYTDIILTRFAYFLQYMYGFARDRAVNIPKPEGIANSPDNPATEDAIEMIAEDMRALWLVPDGPITNLITLMENNGIICLGYELPDAIDSVNASFKFGQCVHNSHPLVIYNKRLNYYRQRFTIAHELGHIILHRGWTEEQYEANHALAEKQAHRFANAFMMPNSSFRESIETPSVSAAFYKKDYWGMSIAAIGRRMKDVGLIDDNGYRSFFINITQRGWRKEEPLDEGMPTERPYYIERVFGSAFRKNIISPIDVIEEFGLRPHDIVKFIGNADKFISSPNDDIEFKEVNNESLTR